MLADIVKLALEEDIGTGDVTSKACVPPDREAKGYFLARENMILAGTEVLPIIYPNLTLLHKNGDELKDEITSRKSAGMPDGCWNAKESPSISCSGFRESPRWRASSRRRWKAPAVRFSIPENHARATATGKGRGRCWRRNESPYRPLRRHSHQEQSHRGGRQRHTGYDGCALYRIAHRD